MSLEVVFEYFNKKKNINERYPDLDSYISDNYVEPVKLSAEGGFAGSAPNALPKARVSKCLKSESMPAMKQYESVEIAEECSVIYGANRLFEDEFIDDYSAELNERVKHLSDTFSEYLFYLIDLKGLDNADVWKNALVDKKVFSKIKNNPDYHPQKLTALCLCIGAKLNLDEAKDLLGRAGYAFSPCDKRDIIFQYFLEREIYDMIDIDIILEEHGLPCIIE